MLLWDAKAARITFTVLVVTALVYGAYAIRRTLFVFVMAVFLAYMLQPLVRALNRVRPRRAPSWAAPAVAMILVVLVLVLIAALAGPPLADEASRLADQLPELSRRASAVETWPLPAFVQPYAERIATFVRSEFEGGAAQALPLARRIGTGVVQVAGDALLVVLVPILAFLFLLSGGDIRDRLTHLPGDRTLARGIVDDLNELLGRFIRALLLLSVAAFVAYGLFLLAIGVPYALLLAAIAAVLEFVPVFGPLLAAIIILGVAGLADYPHLLWIVVFIAAYRVFQDYLLSPRLMGAQAGLHPILVLFGLLAGEELAGVAGIFLSVPVLAAAMIIGRHWMRDRIGRRASPS